MSTGTLPSACDRRAFSLTELLVVMGVIALLAALTTVGYRTIAKDAKLASAKNTVMAVLDNARSLAMRENQLVMVVFRPRREGTREQYIEAVLARWSRQSIVFNIQGSGPAIVDRFVPVTGIAPRRLPLGIQVAAPRYAAAISAASQNEDMGWFTMSHLPTIREDGTGEAPGVMIAVVFNARGETVVRNPVTDNGRFWVDFNNDGVHQWDNLTVSYPGPISLSVLNDFYFQRYENDECYVTLAPFLALFDDADARALLDVSRWTNPPTPSPTNADNRRDDYSQHINQYADRIHFNRYTGVAMK
jgi:prepilin-type N-terminal cleavage/methylation domain-containing protein